MPFELNFGSDVKTALKKCEGTILLNSIGGGELKQTLRKSANNTCIISQKKKNETHCTS